jgi:hypothetical protein
MCGRRLTERWQKMLESERNKFWDKALVKQKLGGRVPVWMAIKRSAPHDALESSVVEDSSCFSRRLAVFCTLRPTLSLDVGCWRTM